MKSNIIFSFIFLFLTNVVNGQGIFVENEKNRINKINIENEEYSKYAKILQQSILKVTKERLPILNTRSSNSINILLALNSEYIDTFKNLEEESFLIEIKGDVIFIIGKTDLGIEYGIYSFVEDYLGINWLFPSSLGEYIPDRSNIILKTTSVLNNPKFISRQLSPIDLNSDTDLGIWGRKMRLHSKIGFHHNMNFYLKNEEIQKLDKRLFSKYNGKYYLPQNDQDIHWQPNFVSKLFLEFSTSKVLDYFLKTGSKSFSLGINDNFLADDRYSNKNSLGFYSYSDDYYKWVNNLVSNLNQTYPEKIYGLLAYYNVSDPPSNFILNSQTVPFLTFERIRWSNSKLKEYDQSNTLAWTKKATQVGWYDYLYEYTYLIPRIYNNTIKEYLSWASDNNIKYYYSEIYPNWGEGPKYWLLTKLLWNPKLDIESLEIQWYKMAVGDEAAFYLKSYFDIWEKYWEITMKDKEWFNRKSTFLPFNDLGYLEYVTLDMVNDSEYNIKNVMLNAKSQSEKERAMLFQEMWKLYKIAIHEYKNNYIRTIHELNQSKAFAMQLEVLKKINVANNTVNIIIKQMN